MNGDDNCLWLKDILIDMRQKWCEGWVLFCNGFRNIINYLRLMTSGNKLPPSSITYIIIFWHSRSWFSICSVMNCCLYFHGIYFTSASQNSDFLISQNDHLLKRGNNFQLWVICTVGKRRVTIKYCPTKCSLSEHSHDLAKVVISCVISMLACIVLTYLVS